MYGLVNQAIEELICAQHGPEAWQQIKAKAGEDIDAFVRMEAYPDSLTYGIVGAACEHLGIAPEQFLEDIGVYWVKFTGASGYGEFLESAGSDLFEILANLDDMHSRIAMVYPQLQPPSFNCEKTGDGEITLHYHSQRDGLAPMVVGLIKGLGEHLDTAVTVRRELKREDGSDHDSFVITTS